jgi:hypothetical protein
MAMKTVEEQMVSDAIAATEKEIFAEAIGAPEADTDVGEQGDRSLEEMGNGLEGQHEDDEAADDTDADADGDDEAETGDDKPKRDEKTGQFKPKAEGEKDGKQPAKVEADDTADKTGKVPPGRLREEAERRRVAEEALAAERAEKETIKGEVSALNKRLDDLMTAVASGKLAQPQAQPQKQAAEEDDPRPDMFADPEAYEAWQDRRLARAVGQVQQTHEINRVEMSMQIAHEKHGKAFNEAYSAVINLDTRNPRNVQTVREIMASSNPGRALMQWHNQRKTLAEVGDDPAKYREKVAAETRAELMKDPEFRKQLLDELRAGASGGDGGKPRTVIRGTPSLNGARGGSMGQITDRRNHGGSTDADIFASAFEDD